MTPFEIIVLVIYYFLSVGFMMVEWTNDDDDFSFAFLSSILLAALVGWIYFPIFLGCKIAKLFKINGL